MKHASKNQWYTNRVYCPRLVHLVKHNLSYSGMSYFYQNQPYIYMQLDTLNKLKNKKKFLELSNPLILRQHSKSSNKMFFKNTIQNTNEKEDTEIPITPDSSLKVKGATKDDNRLDIDKEKKTPRIKHKRKNKVFDDEETFASPSQQQASLKESSSLLDEDTHLLNHKTSKKTTFSNRKNKFKSAGNTTAIDQNEKIPYLITINGPTSIKELAAQLNRTETEVIKFLFLQGIPVTINEILSIPNIQLVAKHFNVKVDIKTDPETFSKSDTIFDTQHAGVLEKRAPLVAVMGHVDHGKTSLLDKIQKKQVANTEAGGITQILAAYTVQVPLGESMEKIVFLDTPGHEAFSEMRSRGALVMDIGILVIAADDGIQPQTVEAIKSIQDAKANLIVAINKIDKGTTRIEKIQEQLTQYNIVPEEWGGDTPVIPISALTGENISTLLDTVLILAEKKNLQAFSEGRAQGIIIEAHVDKNKGVAATILIQQGKAQIGDLMTAGSSFCKLRMMMDESSDIIKEAGPSSVIKIWGFSEIPQVGSSFQVHINEKEAKTSAKEASLKSAKTNINLFNKPISFYFSSQSQKGNSSNQPTKVLNLIIKSSTQGLIQAILNTLEQIPQTKVALYVLSAVPGEITETDVLFASTTKSKIIGFDTTLAPGARQSAAQLNVSIYEYKVIYDLIESLQSTMKAMLEVEYDKKEIGLAVVKDVFSLSRGKVAGCFIESGKLIHNCLIQISRGSKIIYEGNLDSLKQIKQDVTEINSGNECGVLIKDFQGWEKQDTLKGFTLLEKIPSLT